LKTALNYAIYYIVLIINHVGINYAGILGSLSTSSDCILFGLGLYVFLGFDAFTLDISLTLF